MLLATWNVNSINTRLPHIQEFLSNYEPDILCMQETKVVDQKFPRDAFTDRGYEIEIYGEKSYNGVAIASKQSMSSIVKGFREEIAAGSKRLIAATIGDVKVINLYIPNGQAVGSEKYHYKLEWLCALKKHIEENYTPDDQLVICGDFNIAPEDRDVYRPDEWNGSIMASDQERRHLEEIKQWGFVDVFRQHHDEPGLFTWWDYQGGAFRRNMGFRIDHIWSTTSLAEQCTAVMIAREMRKLEKPSDHAPVLAEFDI
jgi:exodeoxyribonuclease III